jgi:hypothetical protein
MASFRAIPLGIYTLGPPRLTQLEASRELPLLWCCPACIFVICSNLRHFNKVFIIVDRKTSQGAWSGEYGVGGQPPCCFGLKIAEQKASWFGALLLCKSQPFVRRLCGCFLLTSSLRQLRTSLIVCCPPSWMNRRTFFTFSSVRLHMDDINFRIISRSLATFFERIYHSSVCVYSWRHQEGFFKVFL